MIQYPWVSFIQGRNNHKNLCLVGRCPPLLHWFHVESEDLTHCLDIWQFRYWNILSHSVSSYITVPEKTHRLSRSAESQFPHYLLACDHCLATRGHTVWSSRIRCCTNSSINVIKFLLLLLLFSFLSEMHLSTVRIEVGCNSHPVHVWKFCGNLFGHDVSMTPVRWGRDILERFPHLRIPHYLSLR